MKDGKLSIDSDIEKEIAQAFENCQIALTTAGGDGWSQVSPAIDGLRIV